MLIEPSTGDVTIEVNGEMILLDACGAAFVKDHGALLFADLHFGKANAYARSRQFLPPYDTLDTLKRMAEAVARHKPEVVIALGDSFHDPQSAQSLSPREQDLLHALTRQTRFVWIAGNHDPQPPHWLSGDVAASLRLGNLVFRHMPHSAYEPGEIAGHLHPCAHVTKWGRNVRRRCFVSDGSRMVLPSFGAYTGGLDVSHVAIASLFAGRFHAYMLGHARVYAVPRHIAV